MAVTIAPVYQFVEETNQGAFLRNAKLAVTGLPANGVTTVPHGLTDARGNGFTPVRVGLEPKSNSNFWENAAADATNVYVGVGAASGTHAVDIYLMY